MIQEQGLTRQRIFSELAKSPHGKLEEYLPVGRQASREDPEFFAHLVAWNARKGQIRDSQVALPLVALDSLVYSPDSARMQGDEELKENALAHLALLAPRDLLRGVRFAKDQKLSGRRHAIPNLVSMYLHSLEGNYAKWERTAVQHRRTLKELYAICHVKPFKDISRTVLFGEDEQGNRATVATGTTFDVIANLKGMGGVEAAAEVITRRIPFLIAAPALGKKLQDPAVLAAVIDRMTPTELTSHMKMLEKLGVRKDPILRATLEKALGRMATGKGPTLKISKALERSERDGSTIEDEDIREKLKAVQEKRLDKSSVDGNWLVLGDASYSMKDSIEGAKQVAATLARMVKGDVHLIFFNTMPTYYNVTGKTLEQITEIAKRVVPNGNTSIGCGVQYIMERGIDVDGIVVVSDGGENTHPAFSDAYTRYQKKVDRALPVYMYHFKGDQNVLVVNCQRGGIDLHVFPITSEADYYSIPNMVQTMRTNRYSLIDEIMEVPLLKINDVLKLREAVRA